MGDGFAGIASIVDDDAETGFEDPQFFGDLGGGDEHAAEQFGMGGRGGGDTRNALAGDDEHVNGGLRIRIVKGDKVGGFMHDPRGDFLRGDLFKDGHATYMKSSAPA